MMRLLTRLMLVGLCCLGVAQAGWTMQRALKSKSHNYKGAPMESRRVQALLVETYTAPTQAAAAGDAKIRTTRVRYANRAGMAASVFVLSGEAECTNTSANPIDAFSVSIVVFDAFHQPVSGGSKGPFLVQQVVEPVARGSSKRVTWEQTVSSSEIFEVAVIITRVRFADGTVWTAPTEELLDVF